MVLTTFRVPSALTLIVTITVLVDTASFITSLTFPVSVIV